MTPQATERPRSRHCTACEGGVEKLSADQVRERLQALCGWELTDDSQRIRKHWEVRDFEAGMEFFNHVAALAEEEGHHPDLHLEAYRQVWITIWTHAIGGLSENDFILAAKIDQLPVRLRVSLKAAGV